MADGLEVRITGIPAFSARLRALGSDMEKKIVRAGVAAAAGIFKRAAVKGAPVLKKPDTRKRNPRIAGQLKKSIYAVRSKSESKPGTEVFVVSIRTAAGKTKSSKNSAFYGRFVEDGHLARGRGQKLKGGVNRRALERKRLKGSGAKFVPGKFFMRQAYQANQDAAIKAFNDRIEARIAKAQRTLNER